MFKHFLIFDIAVKSAMSTQGHHLNNLGGTPVPHAICKASSPSVHKFWRRRFSNVFYHNGPGGLLGHMTHIIYITFNFCAPLNSHMQSGPEVIKLFSCSTHLSMKFFLLINVKMPTIVGILTFISRGNSILGSSESEKS